MVNDSTRRRGWVHATAMRVGATRLALPRRPGVARGPLPQRYSAACLATGYRCARPSPGKVAALINLHSLLHVAFRQERAVACEGKSVRAQDVDRRSACCCSPLIVRVTRTCYTRCARTHSNVHVKCLKSLASRVSGGEGGILRLTTIGVRFFRNLLIINGSPPVSSLQTSLQTGVWVGWAKRSI